MIFKITLTLLGLWFAAILSMTTALVITPASATLEPLQTLTVSVDIQDVEGLYAADIRLNYDPTAIEIIDADPSADGVQFTIDPSFLSPDFVLAKTVDTENGIIHYAVTQLNPSPAVSGSGTLFTVELQALTAGVTTIEYEQYQLSDRDGGALSATTSSSTLNIIAETFPIYLPLLVQ